MNYYPQSRSCGLVIREYTIDPFQRILTALNDDNNVNSNELTTSRSNRFFRVQGAYLTSHIETH